MAVGKGTDSDEDSDKRKRKEKKRKKRPKPRIINHQIVYESSWVNEHNRKVRTEKYHKSEVKGDAT